LLWDSVFAGQFPFLVGGLPFNYIFSADYGNYRLYASKPLGAITSKKIQTCHMRAEGVFSANDMQLSSCRIMHGLWCMRRIEPCQGSVTKRNMLEWVTALDAERGLKNSLKGYVIKMKAAAFRHWLLWFWLLHLKPVFRRQYPFFRLPCGFHRLYSLLISKETVYKTET